ncbi:MAG: phosphate ABC transporter substrate-binding protein PstS [Polyangiaceae bacterium]|nr:phosphate ABC transporter substrate-binding protein PstS [Polyangiaceae bacterium]
MRTWIILIVAVFLGTIALGCSKTNVENRASQGADTLLGAGATFPYPLYARWGHDYNAASQVKLNYQSIGSGGGIQQIRAKTVDFGASDAPLKASELDEAGLVQFPAIMGGVVPVVHLEGIAPGSLVFDGPTLASLFLGEIKKWNDERVKVLNPGLQLPDKDVTIIHRADGSGTTWIFTSYLSKVSPTWAEKVGNDKSVAWPVGAGGKGNEGVAVYVQRVDGSLGYVEYAYAVQNKLNTVKLKNAANSVVAPSTESFQAAAASADWEKEPGFYVVLTNQSGEQAWPIVGASFILMHKEQKDAAKAKALLAFFDYAFREGDKAAKELDYVPMPAAVIERVRKMWAEKIRAGGNPVWAG